MKKIFKILIIIILLVLIALISIPYLYKQEISDLVKVEINKELKAKVDFSDVNLNLFRYFPNFEFEINDLSVVGTEVFEKDTLLSVEQISLKLDLMSVINGGLEINSIHLLKPHIKAMALNDSLVNWDITKASSETTPETEEDDASTSNSSFKIALQAFKIEEAEVTYYDKTADIQADLKGFNFFLSGDFTLSSALIQLQSSIADINIKMAGISYMKHTQMTYDAGIMADMNQMKFTLKDNLLSLNKVHLALNGFAQINEDDSYTMDLSFDTGKNQFKDVLSLIPLYYTKDYSELKATGAFDIKALIKGVYSENKLPAFLLNLKVKQAQIQYPDLPTSIDDINIDLSVNNSDGILDHTVTNLKEFSLKIADNPFFASYISKTPMSDPYLEGSAKGTIDFSKLKQAIPLDSISLNGIAQINLLMKGHLSTIEQEKYDEFDASGNIELSDFKFQSADLDYAVLVQKGLLNINPKHIELSQLDVLIGKSDIHSKGYIQNFLPYYFKGETLKGELDIRSTLIDGNELAGAENTSETEVKEVENDTINTALSVIELPKNIDFKLHSNLQKIEYDTYRIQDLKGDILLKDGIATMKGVEMNIADGLMLLNGSYNSQNISEPKVDFDIKMKHFGIANTYETFTTLKKTVPMAKHCKGYIDVDFKMESLLDTSMQARLETMNAYGEFRTKEVVLERSKLIEKLYKLTKNDNYKQLNFKNIKAKFAIKDGKIEVKPIAFKMNDVPATFSGYQHLNQSMNYTLNLKMPSSLLGNSQKWLNQNLAQIGLGDKAVPKTIPLDILIKGTVKHPKISLGVNGGSAGEAVKEMAKEKAKEAFNQAQKKAIAKAQKEADKLMQSAKATSEKIIAKAQKEANKIKAESDKKAKELKEKTRKEINQLKKKAGNNPFAKAAAEASAKELEKKTNKKIDQLNQTAHKKADKLVNEAKKQSRQIQEEAKKQGDKLIEAAKK